jgi:hypothetical protein
MKKKVVVHPIEVLEENLSPTARRDPKNNDVVTSPSGFMCA